MRIEHARSSAFQTSINCHGFGKTKSSHFWKTRKCHCSLQSAAERAVNCNLGRKERTTGRQHKTRRRRLRVKHVGMICVCDLVEIDVVMLRFPMIGCGLAVVLW